MILTNADHILGPWLCERTGGVWNPLDAKCIGNVTDGKIRGAVAYDHFNGRSIAMHVAGEGANWLTREFLWFAFWYPFEQLKVKRITAMVAQSNAKALKLDLHLGFRVEARLKDAAPDGDLVILRMMKHECKWLGIKRHGFEELSTTDA
jgi:L-amino acid N-acyltransferase YncA